MFGQTIDFCRMNRVPFFYLWIPNNITRKNPLTFNELLKVKRCFRFLWANAPLNYIWWVFCVNIWTNSEMRRSVPISVHRWDTEKLQISLSYLSQWSVNYLQNINKLNNSEMIFDLIWDAVRTISISDCHSHCWDGTTEIRVSQRRRRIQNSLSCNAY